MKSEANTYKFLVNTDIKCYNADKQTLALN